MRKVFIMIMILIGAVSLNAQKSKSLTFSEVIKVDSVSKSELYNRAKTWIVNTYKSSKDVIQMDDKENGQIIGKSVMEFSQSFLSGSNATRGYIEYTVEIIVKDGRYKYKFGDFIHDPIMTGWGTFGLITTDSLCSYKIGTEKYKNRVWIEIKNTIDENINSLIKNLNNVMLKPSEIEKGW